MASQLHRTARPCALVALLFWLAVAAPGQNFVDRKPSPQQVQWQDLEFGVIIHFGTNTFLDREWGDGTADPNVFNPTQFDAEQWMRAIQAAGAKYVVLVAKHHDGFCLWPTEQTKYSVKSSPWRNGGGDVVGDVANAAHKFGLKFGVYLSPWDRHEPRYANFADYDKYYAAELSELARNYGDLVEFWLDGAGGAGHVYDFPRYLEELRTYQTNTLVFADVGLFEYGDVRWVGNEDGVVPYDNWNVIDRHGVLRWRPVEADTRRGLLPEADVKRLQEFGETVRHGYRDNLVARRVQTTNAFAEALDGDPDTFWSAAPGNRQATIEVQFAKPVTFDRALTMEWLNQGQHVEHYRIESWDGKAWKAVTEGHPIGHKKIDVFAPVTASRVRLKILGASGEIGIREFQLYRAGR